MTDGRSKRSLSSRHWGSLLSDVWETGLVVLSSDGRVEFASPRARVLLSASSDSDLDNKWSHVRGQIGALPAQGNTGGAPIESVVTTGGSTPASLRVQVHLIEEPDCVGYLVLIQDLARASAIERLLRQAAGNRSFLALARDTSHNFKDMLNVIAMNVELLARVGTDADHPVEPKQVQRSADVIRRELRRLDKSLDTLFDRNMLERDAPQTFDVRLVCDALLQAVAPRAARQHVTVRSTLVGAEMTGYPDRLRTGLLGLLVNALDAMPNGGTLQLSATRLTPSAIQVFISDTGSELAREQLAGMWTLSFTAKDTGTGLGLAAARSTVEAHGGTITYQPNADGGSSFVIELPAITH